MPERRKRGVPFFTKLVAMATSLEISERGLDRSSAPKMLSFREKIAKIGAADAEIIVLRDIIIKRDKKRKKRQKLTQGKYIAWSAT